MLEEKKKVPVKEGIFEYDDSEMSSIRLLGSQCPGCGERHFPQRTSCPNCSSRELESCFLSSTGTIDTYTVVRQTAPSWQGPVPYIIVVVNLDDGAEVTTHLVGCEPEEVKIGARVKAVPGKLREDEEGNELMAHMFKMID